MKKQYTTPEVTVLKVKIESPLAASTTVTLMSEEVSDGDDGFVQASRTGGSLWDDEDDEY